MLFSMGHWLGKLIAPAHSPDTVVDRKQWSSVQFAEELLKLHSKVISHPCASDLGASKSGYAEIQWELKDGARSAGDLK